MEDILITKDLCKNYKAVKALDRLSMHIPKGSIYGLVGKNGAGKTTLIRVICGLQQPDAGWYCLFGNKHSSSKMVQVRGRIGAVVENPAIYLDMTAQENLKIQYQLLGLPSYEGIPQLLKKVGLENTGKKKAGHFSLGMRQRLGIAVALAGDPDFLVLDEPVNGLDPEGIVEIRELILKLNREQQITILISSHILDELSKIATHYGFVHKGRIVKEISSKELESACRKCIHLTVTNVEVLSRVLDRLGMEYRILSDQEADVYGQVGITQLTMALAQEGCQVKNLYQRDESLENYYINLVGGKDHE